MLVLLGPRMGLKRRRAVFLQPNSRVQVPVEPAPPRPGCAGGFSYQDQSLRPRLRPYPLELRAMIRYRANGFGSPFLARAVALSRHGLSFPFPPSHVQLALQAVPPSLDEPHAAYHAHPHPGRNCPARCHIYLARFVADADREYLCVGAHAICHLASQSGPAFLASTRSIYISLRSIARSAWPLVNQI